MLRLDVLFQQHTQVAFDKRMAGISHLTWSRRAFLALVPGWVPLDGDLVVVLSGVAELLLALGLIALPRSRVRVGWIVAIFFVLIFSGNISQFVTQNPAFGLETDLLRGVRLLFQPVLVGWALWCTGAWAAWRAKPA